MSFQVGFEIAWLSLCMVTKHLLGVSCVVAAPGLLQHSGARVMRTGAWPCPVLRVPVSWSLRQYGAVEIGMGPRQCGFGSCVPINCISVASGGGSASLADTEHSLFHPCSHTLILSAAPQGDTVTSPTSQMEARGGPTVPAPSQKAAWIVARPHSHWRSFTRPVLQAASVLGSGTHTPEARREPGTRDTVAAAATCSHRCFPHAHPAHILLHRVLKCCARRSCSQERTFSENKDTCFSSALTPGVGQRRPHAVS